VINTIGIFSILWLSLIISAIIFVTISSLFGISNILFFNLTSITLNQSDNIIDIFLWLIALTIGVASLKELLYRRTLIPMLESQELGMSSFTVIMTSGLVFGLLHLPQSLGIQASLFQSDLISFSFNYDPQTIIFFATYQFWVAFLIGIASSTTYVFTRNVIYPIMIHTMTNLLFLISYSFAIFENQPLMYIFVILISIISMIGLLFLIYFIKAFLNEDWKRFIQLKSSKRINKGIVGYIGIFTGIMFYISFYPFSNLPALFVAGVHFGILFLLVLKARYTITKEKSKTVQVFGDL
jgi:membrane protease YdiL (CAAX protease family)